MLKFNIQVHKLYGVSLEEQLTVFDLKSTQVQPQTLGHANGLALWIDSQPCGQLFHWVI